MRTSSCAANACAARWSASSRGMSVWTKIGSPGVTLNRAAVDPLDEARHERCAAQERHQRRRSQEPGRPAEEIDLDAVPAEMTIHQQRDDAVVGEPFSDLQRRIQ